jgi:hypothetical protein
MCWNGPASATLATVGIASTTYIALKGEDKRLWIPLAYFSLMELLQAVTYTVIDQCGLPLNQVLTLLGSLHIAFQPFFINSVSMHFIPEAIYRRIHPWVYVSCFIGTILCLLLIYPFEWTGTCNIGHVPFCDHHLCSVSGNWHIAWGAPLNDLEWLYLGYFIPAFFIPLLYGSWKFTLYHILIGPGLASLLTNNINEWPAVWCLMSIGLLLIVIKTPLRQLLYNQRWFWWGWVEPTPIATDVTAPPVPLSD